MGNITALLSRPPSTVLTNATLFLDLDGTLFDLVESPGNVRADVRVQMLLERLLNQLDGRLAVVSGRSVQQIDNMLGEIAAGLWISGSHGCEHRWNGVAECPARPAALDDAAARLHAFAQGFPGVLVEEKSLGIAVHYRMAPQAEAAAIAVAQDLARQHGLFLQHGKMMAELRVGNADKGSAIRAMMSRAPMAYTMPVFAGDDVTDEPGFEAVRDLGGHGILVGEPRPSAADYGLSSPTELREWLWGVLP